MDLSYLTRSAGLDNFIGPPKQKFAEKTALGKFTDILSNASNPEHIQTNDATAEKEVAFRDSLMGNIVGAFVPGVNQYFGAQDKAAKKTRLEALVNEISGMQVEPSLIRMAQESGDPSALIEYRARQNDPLYKLQQQQAQLGISAAQSNLADAANERKRLQQVAALMQNPNTSPVGPTGPVQSRPLTAPELSQNLAAIDPMKFGGNYLDQLSKKTGVPETTGLPKGYMWQGGQAVPIPGISAGDGLSEDQVKMEGEVRKEFEGLNKDFREVDRAFTRIQKSVQDPSAAGDVAMIFNFMKMLDPGSTVREGEFATAQNSAGVPDVIRAQWNKLQNGERLAPAQRDDFFNRSQMLYQGAAEGYNAQAERYRGLAQQYGFSPDRIAKPVKIPEINPPGGGAKVIKFDAQGNIVP